MSGRKKNGTARRGTLVAKASVYLMEDGKFHADVMLSKHHRYYHDSIKHIIKEVVRFGMGFNSAGVREQDAPTTSEGAE